VLRADLAAQRRQLRLGGPAALVVVPGRGRPGSRDTGRAGEARVQEREHEATPRPQYGAYGGHGRSEEHTSELQSLTNPRFPPAPPPSPTLFPYTTLFRSRCCAPTWRRSADSSASEVQRPSS